MFASTSAVNLTFIPDDNSTAYWEGINHVENGKLHPMVTTSNTCKQKNVAKKRKIVLEEIEADFAQMDKMVGESENLVVQEKPEGASNNQLLDEIRLNRRKINQIYSIVKERKTEECSEEGQLPINFPLCTTVQLQEVENMMEDAEFKDKLVSMFGFI